MDAKGYIRLNKRDVIMGLRMLMATGVNGNSMSQSQLSDLTYQNECEVDRKTGKKVWSYKGVAEFQISLLLNIDDPYTPTIASLSRILAVFDMGLVEFIMYIKENEFKM